MKSRSRRLPFLFLLPALAGPAATRAAVVLTGRDSVLNGSYLLGAGPVVLSGGAAEAETSLTQRTALEITGGDAAEGTLHGLPWTAASSFTAGHDFLAESSGGQTRFASTGSTTASTATTGAGVGTTNVRNPGNRLELQFTVDGPTLYALQATASDSNDDNTFGGVQLALRQGDDIWVPIVLLTDTTALSEGELAAGTYRLVGEAFAQADANETVFSGWSYDVTFTPVPEPVTAGLAAAVLGLSAAARWARSGRRGLRP
jgi:hypothetical protein